MLALLNPPVIIKHESIMWPTERFNLSFIVLLVVAISSMGYFLILKMQPPIGVVAGQAISHPPVTVSFFFGGGGQFKLYGYTSPQALVNLESGSGYDETRADDEGYFEFTNRYSPVLLLEVCLTAQDQFGRLSNPVCLPSFPNDRYIVIGPVILPPTLSFDKSNYYVGDEVILSGQTIPNTEVELKMFSKDEQSSKTNTQGFWLVKPAYAFSFPNLTTKSDPKGNYSISLPSTSSKTYRLFAQTDYNKQSSPKSLTLQFQILPVWMIIVKFFIFIWNLIKLRLLEISILVEIMALTYYLIKHYFQPHAIILRKRNDLAFTKHEIVKREEYLPLLK